MKRIAVIGTLIVVFAAQLACAGMRTHSHSRASHSIKQQRTDHTPRIDLIPRTDPIRQAFSEILTDESNEVHLQSMNLCE